MKTQPDLGIKNPYALDDKQFQAAVDLLKEQNANIGEYWSDYTKEIQAFKNGDSVVGTTWQIIANLAQADKAPVEAVLPKEGATGWSDTWMVGDQEQAQELRLQVDGPHHLARGERPGRRVVRRGAVEQLVLRARPPTRTTATRSTPTTRPTSTRSGTGPRRSPSASTAAPTSSARTTATGPTAWKEIKG